MAQDYFAALGLRPGRYTSREIASRFATTRADLIQSLDDPQSYERTRRQLDELHVAYAILHHPARQQEYLRSLIDPTDRVAAMRALIEASLEGGLLRHSRRQELLEYGQALGFNDFQTQLMIAQVQFGGDGVALVPPPVDAQPKPDRRPVLARFTAIGLLSLAMFLWLVGWVN